MILLMTIILNQGMSFSLYGESLELQALITMSAWEVSLGLFPHRGVGGPRGISPNWGWRMVSVPVAEVD